MKTLKRLIWLVAIVMVFLPSCKDSEDVKGGNDYYYYLDIQSEVRLNLSEKTENENGKESSTKTEYDRLSQTVYSMRQAVNENRSMKGDDRVKEASLLTTLDSLYRNYADMNPEKKRYLVCYIKLIRCSLYPNGTVKDAKAVKYYNFWWEDPYGGTNNGSDDSSSDNYLAPPDTLEAVDLGLSVLWANCNIGATQPRNYGAHLAWGEPTGTLWSGRGIGWDDNGYTWDTDNYGGNNPPADIAETALDVVNLNWGDGWHIPSYSEAKELCEQCQWKLQTWGDIKWFEVIGPNGNSIVMPLAGIYGDDLGSANRFQRGPLGLNEMGSYWTSSSCTTPGTAEERGYGVNDGVVTAWCFRIFPNSGDDSARLYYMDYLRAYHMSIRPVKNK